MVGQGSDVRRPILEATPGLGLYTHYTVLADPDYDCGLRETDGRARPSFGVFVA